MFQTTSLGLTNSVLEDAPQQVTFRAIFCRVLEAVENFSTPFFWLCADQNPVEMRNPTNTSDSVLDLSNAPQENHFSFEQAADPFLFAGAPVDPFDMFDPGVDLDVIDACLEGNLNLAYPTLLQ